MQKVMSTKIDESVLVLLDKMSKEQKMSKRLIVEKAIMEFWKKLHEKNEMGALSQLTRTNNENKLFENTFGVWHRDESAEETVLKSRAAFNRSMHRYHGNKE